MLSDLPEPPGEDVAVSAAELADFFGATTQTVRDLASKGVVVRVGHGKYMLRASNRAYNPQLRQQAAGRAASDDEDGPPDLARERALLARAQREGQVMKNAILRGELLPIDDVEAVIGGVLDAVRARLLSLPSRLAADAVGLKSLPQAKSALSGGVHGILDELSATPVVVAAAADRARRRIGRGAAGDALDGADEGTAARNGEPVG